MGFAGVVVGALDIDGHIDMRRMREIMSISGSLAVTFHRAFDMCQNPMIALQQLADLNVARILTSGQQQNAELGLALLKDLVAATQGQGPIIMAGAGFVSRICRNLLMPVFGSFTALLAELCRQR